MRRIAVLVSIMAGVLAAVIMTSQAHAWDCAPGTHDTGSACVPDTPQAPEALQGPGKPHGNKPVGQPPGHTEQPKLPENNNEGPPGCEPSGNQPKKCDDDAPAPPPVVVQPPPRTPPNPPGPPPGRGHTPVTICHHAGPNPNNWHTITIDDSALPAHLAHGDTVGGCAPTPPPVTVVTPPPPVTGTPTPPAAVPPAPAVTPPASNAVVPPVSTAPPSVPLVPVMGSVPPTKPDVPSTEAQRRRTTPRHPHPGEGPSAPIRRVPIRRARHATPVTAAQTSNGSLPFTGLDPFLVALLGLSVLAGGLVLRHRLRIRHAEEDIAARRSGV